VTAAQIERAPRQGGARRESLGLAVDLLSKRLAVSRAFVFDFYGTLAGDRVSVPPMWRVLNDLGYRSHPQLEAIFEPDGFDGSVTPRMGDHPGHGDWLRDNWRDFVSLSGVRPGEVDTVLAYLLASRDRYRACPLPGAKELLSLLGEHGFRLGLCSNWESDIGPYLEQAELPKFDVVVTSAMEGARKPHRAPFCAAATRLGLRPDEVIFVGDNWYADIAGSLRAGMTPIWIRNGRPSRDMPELVSEFESVAQLGSTLATLLGTTSDPPSSLTT